MRYRHLQLKTQPYEHGGKSAMRGFVKVVAGLVLVVCSITLLIGLIGLFAQTVTGQVSALSVGSGLAGILFAGMAWILVDIANAVAPEQEPATTNEPYVPVVATPSVRWTRRGGHSSTTCYSIVEVIRAFLPSICCWRTARIAAVKTCWIANKSCGEC
jgi:hypothetical protein